MPLILALSPHRNYQQVITKYRLTIKPESTVILDLLFRPKYAGSHAFELPLTLAGISGVEGLQRVVAAEAIHPRLKLSSTVIKFGRKVVTPDHTRRFPYSMDFIMTNCDPNDRAIKWAFDDSKLEESDEGKVFSFETKQGFLEPKDSEKITVHFLPTEAKTCEVEVPLYLDDKMQKAYLELSIKGTGMFPKLSFNKPYVLLPTVPLGVKSKATFFVKNTGYENLELQYRLPPSTAKLPLEITFPDGKTLGIAKSRLPVQLSFCSKKTLAFKENIEFMDTDGNKFTIPVIGATDNSLVSRGVGAVTAFADSILQLIPFQTKCFSLPPHLSLSGKKMISAFTPRQQRRHRSSCRRRRSRGSSMRQRKPQGKMLGRHQNPTLVTKWRPQQLLTTDTTMTTMTMTSMTSTGMKRAKRRRESMPTPTRRKWPEPGPSETRNRLKWRPRRRPVPIAGERGACRSGTGRSLSSQTMCRTKACLSSYGG